MLLRQESYLLKFLEVPIRLVLVVELIVENSFELVVLLDMAELVVV